MAKLQIRRGDRVKVISGNDKGAEGTVLRVEPEKKRVVVQGVNVRKRHRKPSATSPGLLMQFGIPGLGNNLKNWLDFSLLPPFDKVSKYFYYSVFASSTSAAITGTSSAAPAAIVLTSTSTTGAAGQAVTFTTIVTGSTRCLSPRRSCRRSR